MSGPGRVGPVARALGLAGLLPQIVLTVALAIWGDRTHAGALPLSGFAEVYAALILSFLGGMWWSMAMRRDIGQGALTTLSVAPSLVAMALFGALGPGNRIDWTLIGLGIAIMLTLLVDRHLVRTGEAPEGWLTLRIPLSVGLGGLTLIAGVLVGT